MVPHDGAGGSGRFPSSHSEKRCRARCTNRGLDGARVRPAGPAEKSAFLGEVIGKGTGVNVVPYDPSWADLPYTKPTGWYIQIYEYERYALYNMIVQDWTCECTTASTGILQACAAKVDNLLWNTFSIPLILSKKRVASQDVWTRAQQFLIEGGVKPNINISDIPFSKIFPRGAK